MTSFQKFKKLYQGKKVLIMGLGLLGGGVGVAKIFCEIGAQVTVTDLKKEKELAPSLEKLKNLKIKFVLGRHRKSDFEKADLIIRNPAVPQDSIYLQIARKNKIPITMDTALFAKFCQRPIIGVTGTRGKTTTATLIYEILKASGKKTLLAGNIKGVASLPFLKKAEDYSWIVLELSSWSLQGFDWERISPQIAVITNIYPDHLNRYQNMQAYIQDKKIIFKYQSKKDFLVLNQENLFTVKMASQTKAKIVWFKADDFPSGWQLKLPGRHNQENAAAAYKVGKILNIPYSLMKKVFANFKGVKYRLEKIAEIDDVTYINDTTSTTPQATIAALRAIEKPIILIAGGASKNLDLSSLAKEIAHKVKFVILLRGTATPELLSLIKKNGAGKKVLGVFDNFQKAILKARKAAQKGEVVLLSPGCASFGLFKNEYHRGEEFSKIVKSLC